MKRVTISLILIFLTIISISAQVTFASLLDEMTDPAIGAQFPVKIYKTVQYSSYDRASTIENSEDGFYVEKEGRDWGKGWFANKDFDQFLRYEKINGVEEAILVDHQGPGVFVRWWSAMGGIYDYRTMISFYIDGEMTPSIRLPLKDLVGGEGLIGEPYSYLASDDKTNPGWRGRNLYFPIPFSNSLKITADQSDYSQKEFWRGFYYQINIRAYDDEVSVEPYYDGILADHQAELSLAASQLINGKSCGCEQENSNDLSTSSLDTITIKTGESWSQFFEGEGAIDNLALRFAKGKKYQRSRSTVIELIFDGKRTLWMPLEAFFGTGYLESPHRTLYTSLSKDGLYSANWFMPFQETAVITIHNLGAKSVTLSDLKIKKVNYQWNEQSLYFHGSWFELRNLDGNVKRDINFITVKGRGIYIGDSLTIFNSWPNWWGEGDEKIFVDNETFPSHIGTGTEDYYGYAWCRPQTFSRPFHSQPCGEGNKKVGSSTNNRVRTLDMIPFESSIRVNMELWHPFLAKLNYAPSAFWYSDGDSSWNIEPDEQMASLPVVRRLSQMKKYPINMGLSE